MIDQSKRFFELTVGEIRELFAEIGLARQEPEPVVQQEPIEYGIAGIARVFNCSKRTALRIKQSGRIDGALNQYGRTIEVNVNKARQLYFNKPQQ